MTLGTSVRPAGPGDVPAITAIYNSAVLGTTATFDVEPKSEADRAQWLQTHDSRHPVLVIEFGGDVVGWASLTQWSDRTAYAATAETTVYIEPGQHGKGFGSTVMAELIEHARRVGLHTLIARISDGSDASLRLHEKLGFERIGTMKEVGHKFGALIDVHIMQLML